MRQQLRFAFLLSLLCIGSLSYAKGIGHLLNLDTPPEGVVFEIVESDEAALKKILPTVRRYAETLRQHYPNIELAVVSHGREEFALQTSHADKYPGIHNQVRSLNSDFGIPVHVCEAHAGWYGVSVEDFPDYVDVVSAGPVQISQYEELDWEVVRVELTD